MKHAIATFSALLMLAPAGAAFSAPGGGMGGAMHGGAMPMSSPSATTSTTGARGNSAPGTRGNLNTGQPNQSCQSVVAGGGSEPGNAANSPGSPFNEPDPATNSPGGNAGTHYAGSAPQNSINPKSVSQYDVACSHQK